MSTRALVALLLPLALSVATAEASAARYVLLNGRFRIHGRAPSKIRYDVRGRLRGGAISGRARLTFLDLDYVGADDSYLCDTGTRHYRASR